MEGRVVEPGISAEAVRTLVFPKSPIAKRGYDDAEVHAYRHLIADALDGRNRRSAQDVHTVVFRKPPIGKRGYDEEAVDAFLDAIEARLTARESTAAAGTSADRSTRVAETSDATNERVEDASTAADAAWFQTTFGDARSGQSSPDAGRSRGLGRLLRFGSRWRRGG